MGQREMGKKIKVSRERREGRNRLVEQGLERRKGGKWNS